MNITLNGKAHSTQVTTVSELIEENGWKGKPVVIEHNKQALVASAHANTTLSEGDVVEVLVLGAGG